MSVISVARAAELLNNSDIVAIPTETVYGLAGRIDFPKAIEKIFATKQRPSFDPLIVHVAGIEPAKACASEWNQVLQILAEKFWPGSLTLIVPKAPHISDIITAGLDTVGVRCPDHPIALKLLGELATPVAAPSANMFSRTSPTTATHVETEFDGNVAVVDGGPCQVGLESTICRVADVNESTMACELQVLRKGAVLASHLESALVDKGWTVTFVSTETKVVAPGQFNVHYRPAIPLVLVKDDSLSDSEIVNSVANGNDMDTSHVQWMPLDNNPAVAARHLYSQLRDLGRAPATVLICRWSAQWTGEFWQSVEDRLNRAAAKVIQSPENNR